MGLLSCALRSAFVAVITNGAWRQSVVLPELHSVAPDSRVANPVRRGDGVTSDFCCLKKKKKKISLMAEAPLGEKRIIKLKRNKEFAYDEESIKFLNNRTWQQQKREDRAISNNSVGEKCENTKGWLDIDFIDKNPHLCNSEALYNTNGKVTSAVCSLSQVGKQNDVSAAADDNTHCFDLTEEDSRNYSSTRLDFLDHYSILSVSPTVRSDSADTMSDAEAGNNLECTCLGQHVCSLCAYVGHFYLASKDLLLTLSSK